MTLLTYSVIHRVLLAVQGMGVGGVGVPEVSDENVSQSKVR